MQKIRTLIVDHCPQMRQALEELFGLQREFQVVGTARHGLDALAQVTLRPPDLIITERDMPVMNGIDMLLEVRKKHPSLTVVVFDNSMERGSTATVEMLLHGANAYIVKPPGGAQAVRRYGCPPLLEKALSCMGRAFSQQPKLPHLAKAFSHEERGARTAPRTTRPSAPTPHTHTSPSAARPGAARASTPARPGAARAATPARPGAAAKPPSNLAPRRSALVEFIEMEPGDKPQPARSRARSAALGVPRAVGIGVSTGGPDALATLLSHLPGDLHVPVFIVQHMPPLFTTTLSERLNRIFPGVVSEGRDGEIAEKGHIYIAPGGKHMVLEPCGDKVRIKLNEDPPVNHCRPAVDVLFKSMSRIFGKRLLVSVLTGMGNDGLEGCRVVSQAGGVVFIQSQETCTVWGMPRAVYEAGLHDKVLALEDMGHMILHELHYYTQSAAAR